MQRSFLSRHYMLSESLFHHFRPHDDDTVDEDDYDDDDGVAAAMIRYVSASHNLKALLTNAKILVPNK